MAQLADAITSLLKQEGIVVTAANGKQYGVYPAEFLNNTAGRDVKLTKSPTLIKLAKRAGLLPVLATIPISAATKSWPVFAESDLKQALDKTSNAVFETARAKLPVEGAEDSTIVTFRTEGDVAVHIALIIGKGKSGTVPLVRVHSSCVTGDLLGSLRCDCGDQLKMALNAIKKEGYGVLLYMNQEGRGIGITNKIRAYHLQEQGMDTYEANHNLGFEGDERDFATAAAILKSLGINKINLLSNNPHKITELKKHGITIAKRVPLIAKASDYNRVYINAKAKKAGHII